MDQQAQVSYIEDTTPIQICILESQMNQKFVQYVIRGEDRVGQFEATRRFNDFFNLRQALSQRWPACYIPPVPAKQTIGNTDKQVVEERKRFLQSFCESIAQIKYLYYSDEFQTFLRTKNADIEKALQALSKQNTVELINKYKNTFQHLTGKQISTEMSFKSTGFGNYLAKSMKSIETLKVQVRALCDTKKRYQDQFNNLTQVLLPNYEKNVLIEYADQKMESLIFNNNNNVGVVSREIRDFTTTQNAYELISDMIRMEQKEIESFQEALAQKDAIEKQRYAALLSQKEQQQELQKLVAGKTTFKSIFTKGSNTEQITVIEKKITEINSEIEGLTQLLDIVTVLLGYEIIDQFKLNKTQKYNEIIVKVSQLETDLNNLFIKLWSEVASETEDNVQV